MAFDERLEETIAQNPDDRAAYAVYADWLQQAGDPRGELAAVQLARESGDTRELAAREEALLETYADAFAGEPQRDGYRIPDHCNEVEYRGGFWKAVRFSGPERVLRALVDHPSARLLQRLGINHVDGSSEDYRPAIELIAAGRWRALRELSLGDMPEGQDALVGYGDRNCGSLDALAAACPRLETLRLLCPHFELRGGHPNLRTLDARMGASPESVATLVAETLPALVTLELGFLIDDSEGEDALYPALRWDEHVLDALFAHPPPRLERIRLWGLRDDAGLADALIARGRAAFADSRQDGAVTIEVLSADELEVDDANGTYIL